VTKRKLIFIVDDDPVVNTLVTRRFIQEGYNLRSFSYGEECLKELDDDPDLVILDYYFINGGNRVMNGMEVYNRIKELKPDTNVIILSGQEKGEIVLELARKGINGYVIKDTSLIDNLLVSVRRIFNRH